MAITCASDGLIAIGKPTARAKSEIDTPVEFTDFARNVGGQLQILRRTGLDEARVTGWRGYPRIKSLPPHEQELPAFQGRS
jgi:hypothetical protein